MNKAIACALFALVLNAAVAAGPILKPEQLVEVKDSRFVACLTAEDLRAFIGHAVAGETTKVRAMLKDRCVSLEAGSKFKLLSVQPTMVEFVDILSGRSVGAWTVIEAFRPIGKP
ncbi:hypothetical protein J7E70_02020 [Variovorax paradoxus]|nr:hypothetical protein [Variovorax paradoxus]MBT2299231.1 hypothetical protein [Variovorax paradoxus]